MRRGVALGVCATAMLGTSLVAGAALADGMRPAAGVRADGPPAGPVHYRALYPRRCPAHRLEIYSYPPTYMFEGKHYFYFPDRRSVSVRH